MVSETSKRWPMKTGINILLLLSHFVLLLNLIVSYFSCIHTFLLSWSSTTTEDSSDPHSIPRNNIQISVHSIPFDFLIKIRTHLPHATLISLTQSELRGILHIRSRFHISVNHDWMAYAGDTWLMDGRAADILRYISHNKFDYTLSGGTFQMNQIGITL